MAKAKNWTTSTVCPLYTRGGNANQMPKFVKGKNLKKNVKKNSNEKN